MKPIWRLFSSQIMPWKFGNSKPYELPSVKSFFNFELLKEKESFLYVYDEILKSYADQNIDWLEGAMEPNLFRKLHNGIQELKEKKQKIKVINCKEYASLTYNDASLLQGVNIDRSKSKYTIAPHTISLEKGTRVSKILVYGSDKSVILKVDVVYASRKKLLLLDQHDNIIEGNNNEDLEYHKFQFEKFLEPGVFKYIKAVIWTLWNGKDPFKDSPWTITDIDDSLDGNPFPITLENNE